MGPYKVFFRSSVEKDLRRVPRADLKKILSKIAQLAKEPRPRGCEKLTGHNRYRIRQGSYRVVYSIKDNELVVWVVRVAHRKDVYR